MMSRWTRRWIARSSVAVALALGAATWAPAAAGAPRAAGAQRRAPIVLVTGALPRGVLEAELCPLLEKELKTDLLDAAALAPHSAGTLYLDSAEDHVTARFEGADGSVTQRTVVLPEGRSRVLSTVVVLAGNVARDEAAELRAELERRGAGDNPLDRDEPAAPPEAAEPEPAAVEPEEPEPAEESAPAGEKAPSRGAASPAESAAAGSHEKRTYFAGVDFVPMLGTSLASRDAVLHASLNVVGGLAGGVDGVQVGSVLNIVTGPVRGLQISGAVNVARELRGLQIGGAANITPQVSGLQIGGAVNVSAEADGSQIGGAINLARAMNGLQIAGAMNIARQMKGFQLSGGVNLADSVNGLQLAGGVNLADRVSGLQLGGGINLAGRVGGAQIGVVNVAGRVKGAQIGVLNIAEEADFSLGVLSFVKRGRYHLDVWGAETGILTAAFKHGGRYFHSLYGVGIRPADGKARVAFTLGLGGHIPLSRRFFADIDALASSVHEADNFGANPALLSQLRAVVGLRLSDRFALFAGPSYNVSVAQSDEAAKLSLLDSSTLAANSGIAVRGWPGVAIGMQAF